MKFFFKPDFGFDLCADFSGAALTPRNDRPGRRHAVLEGRTAGGDRVGLMMGRGVSGADYSETNGRMSGADYVEMN